MKPAALFSALNLKLDEIIKWDLLIGIGTAAGGVWVSLVHPELLSNVLPVGVGLVGVIIGAVVAGVAILGAFLDQAFLRKLKLIDSEPVHYFGPFLFTAFIGVIASLLLLVVAVTPLTASSWFLALVSGLSGFFAGWTIGSLLYCLDALVQFLRLQEAAADIPDDESDDARSLAHH